VYIAMVLMNRGFSPTSRFGQKIFPVLTELRNDEAVHMDNRDLLSMCKDVKISLSEEQAKAVKAATRDQASSKPVVSNLFKPNIPDLHLGERQDLPIEALKEKDSPAKDTSISTGHSFTSKQQLQF